MKYVAFLRGVNVGGNIVRMAELRKALEHDFASVSTYLQSGNVIFESNETDEEALTAEIEAALRKLTGKETTVLLRPGREINRIIKSVPFAKDDTENNHRYVTFLRETSTRELPSTTPNGDLEVLKVAGREVFSRPHLVGSRYGYPNPFIESKLKVRATTRNWAVLTAIAERLKD